jgi:hypothetical protein
VCAASTIYGYGALYSDVRVTFRDGTTKDLIRKAYPLGNFLAAGFSGSVRIGFNLLSTFTECVKMPAEELETIAWEPCWVAEKWAPLAKSIFDKHSEVEKSLGSQLLMVGASPTENCGLGAKIYFVRFVSPDFKPNIMSRAIKICSIGSGAAQKDYKLRLKPLFRLTSGILKAEIIHPSGWGQEMGFAISHALNHRPHAEISPHIYILIIRRGQAVLIQTNDEDVYPGDGSKIEFRMPRVAHGYDEFLELANSLGQSAAGAAC